MPASEGVKNYLRRSSFTLKLAISTPIILSLT